jgi:hypothetical protein
MAVPSITRGLSDRLALSIAVGVPAVTEHLADLAWLPVTNDLDRTFHWRLLVGSRGGSPNRGNGTCGGGGGGGGGGGARNLSPKQRDALRKTDSLDAVLRIGVLKLPAVLFSMVQAYHLAMGVGFALLLSLGLVGVNAASRAVAGQGRAIEDNWEKCLRRNETL